jgi:hypothetical protein
MLPTLLGTVAVAWVAVFLARPRRPMGYDETPWMVYSRFCGVRDRMMLFAVLLTAGAVFAGILGLAHSAKAATRIEQGTCTDAHPGHYPTCYRVNENHTWELWQRDDQAGGKWRLVATIPPKETRGP